MYYPRIVLRDFFKVAKISINRVRYVNRSYIRNEKWRHGYYTGLFWRLWADDMLINFAPEIDRFIFTFYVVFIIYILYLSKLSYFVILSVIKIPIYSDNLSLSIFMFIVLKRINNYIYVEGNDWILNSIIKAYSFCEHYL